MLILQRKVGEALLIGDNITVSVVSVNGGRVRLSISAPEDVPILRSELVNAIAANQESIVSAPAPDGLLGLLGSVLHADTAHQHPELIAHTDPIPD